jgi:hypothetical protein
MPRLLVNQFDGLVPRTEAHELADNQAQVAQNVELYAGELRAWRGSGQDVLAPAPIANVQTIYKLYNYAGVSQWLQWASDVDVALSPIVDNGDIRFYYTGDTAPRKSNYAMIAGGQFQDMGVPAPVAAPTLTATTSGSGSNQTRSYVYTFVNAFGVVEEESAPSPATQITIPSIGSTVTVSLFDTPPAGNHNWTKIRIYRSVTGATTASYQFVAEIPVGTPSYADSLTVAQLGAALDTIGWRPPPSDMTGIVNLGNGVLAGFSGNTLCFSEPFFPHAWPLAYQLTFPYRIVGLGVFGSSVVVMTTRYPYIVSGGTPGAMAEERVPILEPCVSKRSIISNENGVTYASPNGLVNIGPGTRGLVTEGLFRRKEWQALQPQNLLGATYGSRYVGAFNTGPLAGQAIVLDPGDKPAMCQVAMSGPKAVHVDSQSASVWFVNAAGSGFYQLDIDAVNLLAYTWRSKKWYLPVETSWSVAKVRADYTTGAASIAIYADGVLVGTVTPANDLPTRLPAFRCREFFFEVTGTRSIKSIQFATSVRELDQ